MNPRMFSSKANFVHNRFGRHARPLLGVGYVIAGLWLASSAAFAFQSWNIQTSVTPINAPLSSINVPSSLTAFEVQTTLEEVTSLRDPFAKAALASAPAPMIDPAAHSGGLRLKAIILSTKNGAVIEQVSSNAVYFLSEGESVEGILVKKITRVGATVEVDGKSIDLSLSGGQR